MAQDWFTEGTSGASAPQPSRPGVAILRDPYAAAEEDRKRRDQQIQETQLGIAQAGEARSDRRESDDRTQRGFDNTQSLRKEFDGLASVKQYKLVFPALASALNSARNPQGDNALIYAYAKVMDPDSAVREAEGEAAAGTAGAIQAAVERYKKSLGYSDARGLPEGVARGLLAEMNRKVAGMARAYGRDRAEYQRLAQVNGIAPEDVVGPFVAQGNMAEYQRGLDRLREDNKAAASIAGSGDRYVTDEDRAFFKRFDAAYRAGATQQELRGMLEASGRQWTPDIAEEVGRRDRGEPTAGFLPSESGIIEDIGGLLGDVANHPLGTGVASALNAGAFGVPQLLAGDEVFDAMRRQNPKAAFAGDVLGGIMGTAGAAYGLTRAGLSLPRAATAANIGYGPIYGFNTNEDNRAVGAGIGLVGSLVGEGLGRYVAAPAIEALSRTRPVQAGLGMFGKRVPRKMDQAEMGLVNDILPNLEDIRVNLTDAERLGLPYSLADASPAARSTLGASTRLDPVTATSIGNQLSERSLGQADRAVSGLSRLAEPVDMRATTDQIFKAAQEAASPFYERAYANPAVATPEISNLMQRPSLQNAMGRARNLIAEEGGNPTTMGFMLDAQGNPVLNPLPERQLAELGAAQTAYDDALSALQRADASLAGNVDRNALRKAVQDANGRLEAAKNGLNIAPTVDTPAQAPVYNWKALDYAKRGLDDVLESRRDVVTRRLPTDGETRAIQNTRVDYRNALGRLNDDYRQGLDAYSNIARRNDDLNAGFSAADPGVNMAEFGKMYGSVIPENTEYFQRGYTTNMADRINRARESSNPYNLVAGSPDQQNKLAAIFPEGSADFLRQRQLERDMELTAREVLGGSPTAGRLAANERFAIPDLGTAAEIGLSAATGMPPVGALARGGEKMVRGMFGRRGARLSAERARSIAPILSDPNPGAAKTALQQMIDDMDAMQRYQNAIRAGAGGVLAPAAAIGATSL